MFEDLWGIVAGPNSGHQDGENSTPGVVAGLTAASAAA